MTATPSSPEELTAKLAGTVSSVPTIFDREGNIDWAGMRNFIDFATAGGSTTMLLTYGDSLYSLLTDQEVAEVTRLVVEHTAGRAVVVAADRMWSTSREIEFARWASDLGVDVLMVLPPDWGHSCTRETLVAHYSAVAQHIPVMVVTNLFAGRQALGLEVLKTLCDDVPGVVAVKDDVAGPFARKMALIVHGRMSVISGGQKQNHLNLVPYGCDGYMSTFIKFHPNVTHRYWRAIRDDNIAGAREIVRSYDFPFFDFVSTLTGGFDAGIHGTMELFGVAGRWRRKPYHSLGDDEMELLSDFFRRLGLL